MDKRIKMFQSDYIERMHLVNEVEDLMNTYEGRKQYLENLMKEKKEWKKTYKETNEQTQDLEINSKKYESQELLEEAEAVMKEVEEQEATIQRTSQDYAELTQKKRKMELEFQQLQPYYDFMDCVCKLTAFKNVDEMIDHVQHRFQIRDQLIQKEKQKTEHVEQRNKELQELKDQHELTCLQKTNELVQLQTTLEEARAETLIWEQKWNHIQGTASKKTLKLGQIKMATLTLYESFGGKVGAGGLAIDDTEKQLDEIKTFILDSIDILKQYQDHQKKEDIQTEKEKMKTSVENQ